MATLYELDEAIANFDLAIDEETGEITNAEELDALEIERKKKIENIGMWIKNLRSDADAIKEEAKKLTARAKAAENKAERLKEYLTTCLAGEKFSTPRVSVTYRATKAVNVTNLGAIPDKYKVLEVKADKRELLKALDAGEEIEGAEIEKRESTIVK